MIVNKQRILQVLRPANHIINNSCVLVKILVALVSGLARWGDIVPLL